MSTPRSVRAKAQYVREEGLGGIFVWMCDDDNALLTNAP
ncbi:MAG: hypothetical protein NT086_14440 [Proteobacteria bacterium]|nr:hypothetical protein [Pseudomonadota bacterium]